MAKGNKFLKVTGILMIVFGTIGFFIMLFSLAVSTMAYVAAPLMGVMLLAATFIGIIGSVFEIIAGIVGVANAKKPEKANVCLVFGIISLICELISLVLSILGNTTSDAISLILSAVCGLAIPVLYIIGAVLNKQEAMMEAEVEVAEDVAEGEPAEGAEEAAEVAEDVAEGKPAEGAEEAAEVAEDVAEGKPAEGAEAVEEAKPETTMEGIEEIKPETVREEVNPEICTEKVQPKNE